MQKGEGESSMNIVSGPLIKLSSDPFVLNALLMRDYIAISASWDPLQKDTQLNWFVIIPLV